MMFILIVLLAAVCGSSFAEECKALGEAIYIPKEDLVGKIPNGVNIFKKIPEECIEKREIGTKFIHEHFYKDTSSFYKSISTSTQLDASFQSNFAMGATLDARTKAISSNDREVSGASLNLHFKSFEKILQKNCILTSQFMNEFQSDFEALETEVDKPWQKVSWRNYDMFMQKYGSHVISGIVYGSSIEQYVFAQSNKHYSQRDFAVKACAEVAGPGGPGLVKVKACADVTSSEIKKTSNMETSNTIVVTGGKPETRSKVGKDNRKPELIDQFLGEGNSDPGPIQVLLTPVWKIMKDFYSFKDNDMVEKAMNMEYYFQGYLNYGCNYDKKTDSNIELQKFTKSEDSKPGRPEFICSIAPEGCHDDDDCQCTLKGCTCKGKTCVQYKMSTQNTGTQRIDAKINKKEDWSGDNGCKLSLHTKRRLCKCKEEKTDRLVVWSSSSLRDAITTKNEVNKYKLQGGILHS